ncbi:MAG TPA: NAD(P)H-dependent oxidoreductase subunit E [Terriglobales bacterium]|nr:NAD(P)H-dependent oxidoreductase subunit E [Terriglobales bacterium]
MPFSPQLEQRFQALMARYPARRSAMVPMLLYAQDELGYLTPAAITRIAELLGESEMAVREVIGYYSMLRTEPAGKFHVQVCTNISCLLRGGGELYRHCEKRLGIGHKQRAADGVFSLEEVECIGACSWAPAVQVNYDFHQELTIERLDQVLDAYQARGRA